MQWEEIKELIRHLESGKLKKIHYKKGDFELQLEKEELPSPPKASLERHEPTHHSHSVPHPKGGKKEEAEGTFVTSPMVGTFYAAPGIGEAPFVHVGQRVTEQTVVCIIEAMKVMNEVKAGVAGVVAEVLTENGGPVEFGTRLFRIR